MCDKCGCGLPGEDPVRIGSAHDHGHDHGHEHEHPGGIKHSHSHEHSHPHEPGHSHGPHDHHHHEHSHEARAVEHEHERRTLEVRQAILEKNDRLAERNRGFFAGRRLFAMNVLSSPGSGKTTFLRETVKALKSRFNCGIIVGDLATDNDAQRLREAGAPVIQVTTGTMCHLEAGMIAEAASKLPLEGPGLLIIENVGNLVCPASYDLGEEIRLVLLSVTEGEDKPLKYPPMFQSAQVVIVSKSDLAAACEFDREKAMANLRRMSPGAVIFELSAKTGAGMQAWLDYISGQLRQKFPAAKS